MALQLTKQYRDGTSASYWRITRINHQSREKSAVSLAGYVSKEVSDVDNDGSLSIDSLDFYLDIPKTAFINGNVYEVAYNLIVSTPVLNPLNINQPSEWASATLI